MAAGCKAAAIMKNQQTPNEANVLSLLIFVAVQTGSSCCIFYIMTE